MRARVWFVIFCRVGLTGLFGGVKYNRFWKLFGAMLYFIVCMNNVILNMCILVLYQSGEHHLQ